VGLVSNLARPGGNVTGFRVLVVELNVKRLELLSEIVTNAKVIALLVNPNSLSAERIVREVQVAGNAKGGTDCCSERRHQNRVSYRFLNARATQRRGAPRRLRPRFQQLA